MPPVHSVQRHCSATDPKRRWLYYATGATVAGSRAYVRIHHASDVVAGCAFGAAFGALTRKVILR